MLQEWQYLQGLFCSEHYNQRRPHQSLNQATPQKAWQLLEHTPATEPITMVVLEAKAAEYLMKRRLGSSEVNRADLVVSKTGDFLKKQTQQHEPGMYRGRHRLLVRVNRDHCQAYYRGHQISLPQTYVDRPFVRTITDDEFISSDPEHWCYQIPLINRRVVNRARKGNSSVDCTNERRGHADSWQACDACALGPAGRHRRRDGPRPGAVSMDQQVRTVRQIPGPR